MAETSHRPERTPESNNPNGKKGRQRGYKKKNPNPHYAQKKANSSTFNGQNQRNILTVKNVPKEVILQVNLISKKLDHHFTANEVYFTLKDNNFSPEPTLEQLKRQKENSWSSLVKKNLVTTVEPTVVTISEPKSEPKKPHNTKEAKKQNAEETIDEDPQEKVQVLTKTITEELNEVKQKEYELMNIKQLLDDVKVRDSTVESILQEKQELKVRKQSIHKEIDGLLKRMKEIDEILKVAEIEKRKKIIEIEEKFATKR